MASIKIVDEFLGKLEELAELGRDSTRFAELVAKHEARTLEQLFEKLTPVMEYIDGPITTREEWAGPKKEDQPGDRRQHFYKEPGIVLVNNFESTVRDGHGRMRYAGFKVVLTRSGKLVQLDRSGSWDEEQSSAFWATDTHQVEVEAGFAERHLTECVSSIVSAIERGIERQRDKRSLLRSRLAMLKTIQRVLDGLDEPIEVKGPDADGELPVAGHGAG